MTRKKVLWVAVAFLVVVLSGGLFYIAGTESAALASQEQG